MYTKSKEQKLIFEEADKVIKRIISYISAYNCVEQLVEFFVGNIKFSDDPKNCTILHALYGKCANSLGISRLFSLMLRYFGIKS